ncbi:MAG TPA: prephenate dehydrogenase/arogenate dehydrogenase family protein [Arenicellales bacterium]|nr:prephenate dehydrogenase/arogenate dehydrogenase family protein [Arenicellales bacterium]
MTDVAPISVAIIGVGLIGGSLARALKASGAAREVVGVARSRQSLAKALELGVIDRGETELAAIGPVDVVVIATPVRAMPEVMRQLAPHLAPATVVTDAGSVKRFVCDAAVRHLGSAGRRLVAGHPIAGTENSGVDASFPSLFEKRTVILTPEKHVDDDAVELVSRMWRATGADVVSMDPDRHDSLLAATSHLPHMVAYTLVNCLASDPRHEELFRLAAGGFYDFTRIASSDPVMWRDIALTNTRALVESMKAFRDGFDALIEAMEAGDEEALYRAFFDAKQARDLGLARKNGDQ